MSKWKSIITIGFIVLLSACSQYEITLNDNKVYTPQPLYTDFRVSDLPLQNCLDQTIKDQKITAPSELKQLTCTHSGIKSLEGIGIFSHIEALNLSSNKLTSLAPLAQLGQIKLLLLKENQITDAAALLNLLKLENLDLSANPTLPCQDISQLRDISSGNIRLPSQCL